MAEVTLILQCRKLLQQCFWAHFDLISSCTINSWFSHIVSSHYTLCNTIWRRKQFKLKDTPNDPFPIQENLSGSKESLCGRTWLTSSRWSIQSWIMKLIHDAASMLNWFPSSTNFFLFRSFVAIMLGCGSSICMQHFSDETLVLNHKILEETENKEGFGTNQSLSAKMQSKIWRRECEPRTNECLLTLKCYYFLSSNYDPGNWTAIR